MWFLALVGALATQVSVTPKNETALPVTVVVWSGDTRLDAGLLAPGATGQTAKLEANANAWRSLLRR